MKTMTVHIDDRGQQSIKSRRNKVEKRKLVEVRILHTKDSRTEMGIFLVWEHNLKDEYYDVEDTYEGYVESFKEGSESSEDVYEVARITFSDNHDFIKEDIKNLASLLHNIICLGEQS